jgi:hypothetical protein
MQGLVRVDIKIALCDFLCPFLFFVLMKEAFMAKEIVSIDELQRYLEGLYEKSEHHAWDITSIIYPLVGFIVLNKDKGTDISVFTREGEMKNVIWVWINGSCYAFSYNHETGHIEIRLGTTRGKVKASISNKTTIEELKKLFEKLWYEEIV